MKTLAGMIRGENGSELQNKNTSAMNNQEVVRKHSGDLAKWLTSKDSLGDNDFR